MHKFAKFTYARHPPAKIPFRPFISEISFRKMFSRESNLKLVDSKYLDTTIDQNVGLSYWNHIRGFVRQDKRESRHMPPQRDSVNWRWFLTVAFTVLTCRIKHASPTPHCTTYTCPSRYLYTCSQRTWSALGAVLSAWPARCSWHQQINGIVSRFEGEIVSCHW